MKLKIDHHSIIDVQQELDPELHREVFTKACNDIVLRSLPKVNTQIKRKWNLIIKKNGSAYDWVVASAVDGTFSKRGGRMNFASARVDKPVIVITMDGSPINDKRFDFSFDKEIASVSGNKKKTKTALNRKIRASKKDKYALKRPRVKILKSKSATTLKKAFYAKFQSGHEGIFRKRGKRIIELRTITLPSMFQQIDYDAILSRHYQENMVKRYDHYLLQALKRK